MKFNPLIPAFVVVTLVNSAVAVDQHSSTSLWSNYFGSKDKRSGTSSHSASIWDAVNGHAKKKKRDDSNRPPTSVFALAKARNEKRDLVLDLQVGAARAIIGVSNPLISFCNTFLSVPTATSTKTVTGTVSTYATTTVTSTPLASTTVTPTTITETFYTPTTADETITLSTTETVSTLTVTVTEVTSTPLSTFTEVVDTVQTTEVSTAPEVTRTTYPDAFFDKINAKDRMVKVRRAPAAPVPVPTPLRAFASNVISSACVAFTKVSTVTTTKPETKIVYTSTSTSTATAATSTITSSETASASETLPTTVTTLTQTNFYPPDTETVFTSTAVQTVTATADTSTITEPSTSVETISQTVTPTTTVTDPAVTCRPAPSAVPIYTAGSFLTADYCAPELGNANFADSSSGSQLQFRRDSPIKVAVDLSASTSSGRIVNADNSCLCWSLIANEYFPVYDGSSGYNNIQQVACDPSDPTQVFDFTASGDSGYTIGFGGYSINAYYGDETDFRVYLGGPYDDCLFTLAPAGESTPDP